MATVINNPVSGEGSDSVASIIIVVIVLLVAAVLFFVYGLPAIRNSETTPQNDTIDVNVTLPPAAPSPTPGP